MLGPRALLALALLGAALAPRAHGAEGRWLRGLRLEGTVAGVKGAATVNLFLPAGYAATRARPYRLLVALHGWRGRAAEWERRTPIARLASARGYVIVAPELGTTVYERSFFPETSPRHRWGAIPGGRWVGEVVLPEIRARYHVSRARSGTGVLGISTGGRGAALLAAYYPERFGAFAALSADYDITMAPTERTCTYVYGPYARFPERWRADNSRTLLARLERTPALLIHGARDRVCPVAQSRLFARELRQRGYDARLIEEEKLGHEWRLWAGSLAAVFAFFDEKLR